MQLLTNAAHASSHVTLADPNAHHAMAVAYGTGGTGQIVVRGLSERIGEIPGFVHGFVDTRIPDSVPPHRAVLLAPQALPHTVTPAVEKYLPLVGLTVQEYEQIVPFVGDDGIGRVPSIGSLAALMQFGLMKQHVQRDFAAAAQACKGAKKPILLTCASAAGGTGTPTARVMGLAGRIALGESLVWIHVLVASSLLPTSVRTRRTLALEHQQLREFVALMSPGALLALPDAHAPIGKPGPDHVLVLASSLEAPRTLEEAIDELAGVVTNFLA